MSHPSQPVGDGSGSHHDPAPQHGASEAPHGATGAPHAHQGTPHGQDPNAGATPPPGDGQGRKRWPLFAGIGCGCLLLLAIAIAIASMFLFGGGDDPEPTPTPTVEETTPEETTPEETTPEETTPEETTPEETTPEETTPEETATDEGDISAEDEQAAKERMVEFIDTTFSGDYEGACTMIMNPMTNEPMSGSEASDCADGMSQSAGDETMEDMVGVITPDMIDMTPLDDGRLEASFPGSTETFTLIKGDDGQWYIDGAELM